MITDTVDRIRAIHKMVTRATLLPLLVRGGIFLCALAAFALAYPVVILANRLAGLLVIAAVLPALAPKGRWPTITALVAVGGWLISTSWYGEPVALWRLLGLAAFLYLIHTLAALAALLPSDAVLAGDTVTRWVLRALGVVLAASVLSVLLLSLAGRSGDQPLVLAALGGLVVAVLASVMLSWLLRRG